tara:strand:+ start:230 stop:520 length:291 start_codon:yes stop_codon:yes gene_type:complete
MQKRGLKVQEKTVDELISEECLALERMLLLKNSAYNNSLHTEPPLFPIDTITGIQARINDKLNRIKQVGLTDETEDSVLDLIGYLIHLRIALKLNK